MSQDTEGDHEDLGKKAEREAEDLKHQGDKLERDIDETKSDWERKQDDSRVPGAVPDPADEGN